MSTLNGMAYKASSGRFLMFVNDDIVIQTTGWDEHIMKALAPFEDGISLAHVNDGFFKESLCIFPCMPRQSWKLLESGFDAGYWRYRLDDHIYNVFKALERVGHKRIVYLEDVSFYHKNFQVRSDGTIGYGIDRDLKKRDEQCYD